MSSTYQNLTPYQLRWIDDRIHNIAWQRTKFLNFFEKSPGATMSRRSNGSVVVDGGLVRSVDEGLEEIITTKWTKMKPGQIAGGLQDIPRNLIKIEQDSQPLMYLATKIAIPQNYMDAWENNQYIKAGNMLAQATDQAMSALVNQVDQFIAYGDDMKTPLSHDYLKAAGKFTGLFNGFQSFSGGLGEDDVMTAAGDYIGTYVNGRENLKGQGLDAGPYFILSDNTTAAAAEQGNNLYTTYAPVTERRALIREYGEIQGELGGWIDSINAFPGSNTSQNAICVTQPFISQRGEKIEPAYLLYVGYNFRVFPLWNGGLNDNLEREVAIVWSGRLQQINDYALYHTGATLGNLTVS